MIDLNKERELFESKFKKAHWVEYDEKRNKYFCLYVADSEANKYDLMWQVWQFSIDREGYKLIPDTTLEEALGWANCASSESWTDEQRDDIDIHYKVIHTALNEIVENK